MAQVKCWLVLLSCIAFARAGYALAGGDDDDTAPAPAPAPDPLEDVGVDVDLIVLNQRRCNGVIHRISDAFAFGRSSSSAAVDADTSATRSSVLADLAMVSTVTSGL